MRLLKNGTYYVMALSFCPSGWLVVRGHFQPLEDTGSKRSSTSPRVVKGAVLRTRLEKNEVLCHSRCGTIKILPCSKALRAEHRPTFCSLSPVMVTSPYKWNILERNVKPLIINQFSMLFAPLIQLQDWNLTYWFVVKSYCWCDWFIF
jgi:hypothetical protein